MLNIIFFICFGVGVGFVVISFFIGEVLPGEGFDQGASFMKPTVLATFLTVFGGAGLIAESRTIAVVAVGIAALSAFAMSFLLYRFVVVPLYRAQNTSTIERQSLIGYSALVTEKMSQSQYGRISFNVNGSRHSAPAKSEDGGEINRGESVEIVYIDKNTYYVRRKEV